MIKEIQFNPHGESLWINVEMTGLYFISYTYQLWSANLNGPPILTNPLKSGNNKIPHDDYHPVINDYNPTELVSNYRDRIIDVRFWVKKGDDDNGYVLSVSVLQGNVFQNAHVLNNDEVSSSVGEASIKEEFITIKLIY